MKKNEVISIIKGFAAFFIYFLISEFATIPLDLLKIDVSKLSKTTVFIYEYFIDIIIIGLIFLLFKDEIIKAIKDFKENKNTYFKKYFKYWFLLLGLVIFSNIIIMAITGGQTANNQETVLKVVNTSPILAFFLTVVFAPIAEELAFRLSFRHIFKNDELFILASGIIFGAFHVIPLYSTWKDLLYLIPYSIPGCIFAYLVKDSKNICTSIAMHIFHNGLLISLYIMSLFLK